MSICRTSVSRRVCTKEGPSVARVSMRIITEGDKVPTMSNYAKDLRSLCQDITILTPEICSSIGGNGCFGGDAGNGTYESRNKAIVDVLDFPREMTRQITFDVPQGAQLI